MPDRTSTQLNLQIEEIRLIKYSLLPGEVLVFLDYCAHIWEPLLVEDFESNGLQADHTSSNHTGFLSGASLAPPHFAIKVDDSKLWFEVELPDAYPDDAATPLVAIKGEGITRHEQERWQAFTKETLEELTSSSTEYLVYTLLSSHLLPKLKSEVEAQSTPSSGSNGVMGQSSASGPGPEDQPSGYHHALHHALLTSHHLISPSKRRNLQQWSSSLSVSGFAKVGYPGVIYVYGAQEDVEEFVGNVKAMQWLALRVRFVEALPLSAGAGDAGQGEPRYGASIAGTGNAGDGGSKGYTSSRDHPTRRWTEVEKVGEVVEEMKRMGRESDGDWKPK